MEFIAKSRNIKFLFQNMDANKDKKIETDANPLVIDVDPNNPVTEIESLCMNCHDKGTTRLLTTKIPFLKI